MKHILYFLILKKEKYLIMVAMTHLIHQVAFLVEQILIPPRFSKPSLVGVVVLVALVSVKMIYSVILEDQAEEAQKDKKVKEEWVDSPDLLSWVDHQEDSVPNKVEQGEVEELATHLLDLISKLDKLIYLNLIFFLLHK